MDRTDKFNHNSELGNEGKNMDKLFNELDNELPEDNAEQECDIYEFLGVENEEDLEDELEAIAGGRYDED